MRGRSLQELKDRLNQAPEVWSSARCSTGPETGIALVRLKRPFRTGPVSSLYNAQAGKDSRPRTHRGLNGKGCRYNE